jgi:hypothetical protein
MFKIINRLTPEYLHSLLPPQLNQVHTYNTRGTDANNYNNSKVRLSMTKNAFINSTLQKWNNLDESVKISSSIASFKLKLKSLYLSTPNRLYSQTLNKSNTHLARMRMGLSALNQQIFGYNFIDSPDCNNCNIPESTKHLFLQCPLYSILEEYYFYK